MNKPLLNLLQEFAEKVASVSSGMVTHINITMYGHAGIIDISKPIERVPLPSTTMFQSGSLESQLPAGYMAMVTNYPPGIQGRKNLRVIVFDVKKILHKVDFESTDRGFDMVTEIVKDYQYSPVGPFYISVYDISTDKDKFITSYAMSALPADIDDILKTYDIGI